MASLITKSNIPDLRKKIEALKHILPHTIGNLAKTHYVLGFKTGGGQTDSSLSGWAARKQPKSKRDKRRVSRAILVDTSHLKNDIDVRRTTFKEIVLGTLDTGYANYINEGTEHMPQREFLGDSKKLDVKMEKHIIRKFKQQFG